MCGVDIASQVALLSRITVVALELVTHSNDGIDWDDLPAAGLLWTRS